MGELETHASGEHALLVLDQSVLGTVGALYVGSAIAAFHCHILDPSKSCKQAFCSEPLEAHVKIEPAIAPDDTCQDCGSPQNLRLGTVFHVISACEGRYRALRV